MMPPPASEAQRSTPQHYRAPLLLLGAVGFGVGVYAVTWNLRMTRAGIDDLMVPLGIIAASALSLWFGARVRTARVALLALLITLGAWLAWRVAAINTAATRDGAARVVEAAVAQQLAALCGPDPAPVPEAAVWSNRPGAHRAMLLRQSSHGGDWRAAYNQAQAWTPAAQVAEVALVACVRVTATTLDVCAYTIEARPATKRYDRLVERWVQDEPARAAQRATYSRARYTTEVSLREARTARLLTRWEDRGSDPPPCEGGTAREERHESTGSLPTTAEIIARLQPWLEGRAPQE